MVLSLLAPIVRRVRSGVRPHVWIVLQTSRMLFSSLEEKFLFSFLGEKLLACQLPQSHACWTARIALTFCAGRRAQLEFSSSAGAPLSLTPAACVSQLWGGLPCRCHELRCGRWLGPCGRPASPAPAGGGGGRRTTTRRCCRSSTARWCGASWAPTRTPPASTPSCTRCGAAQPRGGTAACAPPPPPAPARPGLLLPLPAREDCGVHRASEPSHRS